MNQKDVRARLFDVYAKNLTYYCPELQHVFLCPLCGDKHDRDSLDSENKLTIEHCIPGSVGGRLKTLTCGRCNNAGGTNLDAHLERRLASDDFLEGLSDSAERVDLQVEGLRVGATLIMRAGGTNSMEFNAVKKLSNPTNLLAADDYIANAGDGIRFGFTYHARYNPRRARLAMVRAAFLLMFRQYGYGYVLSKNSSVVRRQLQFLEEDVIPDQAIFEVAGNFPVMNVPTIVTSPLDIRCYMVLMRLQSRNRTRTFGVALPGFTGDAGSLYETIVHKGKECGHINMEITGIEFHPRHLANPATVTPLRLWLETLEGGRDVRPANGTRQPPG